MQDAFMDLTSLTLIEQISSLMAQSYFSIDSDLACKDQPDPPQGILLVLELAW